MVVRFQRGVERGGTEEDNKCRGWLDRPGMGRGVFDAEADGSAVVEVLALAEPPGGTLRGGATQRVPGLMVNSE